MAKTTQLREAIDEIVYTYLKAAWPDGEADHTGTFMIDDSHSLELNGLMNDIMTVIRDNAT